ncbi:MAG TPA: PQQ-dependent sugar dehydrogenase, partial [Luteolibacter sp.]|nr:PQQ-dependent sugar dehydrogenase [Luteolibacter sp.]
QPYSNHNGGWTCFGPDGMLYIGSGDGGSGNDPENRAQDLGTLLGKILRIDVSKPGPYRIPADNPFVGKQGARGEIWAYGLRNPWRCSFDRQTGDLWIGDVGQNQWEEINFMPAGKGAGANYGWRLREGLIETPKKGIGGPKPEPCVEPVHVYAHGSGPMQGLSVTGGYVYRGPISSLKGRYIFADFQQPRLWSLRLENGKAVDLQNHSGSWKPSQGNFNLISSFAEDLEGNLYVICLSGDLFMLSDR